MDSQQGVKDLLDVWLAAITMRLTKEQMEEGITSEQWRAMVADVVKDTCTLLSINYNDDLIDTLAEILRDRMKFQGHTRN